MYTIWVYKYASQRANKACARQACCDARLDKHVNKQVIPMYMRAITRLRLRQIFWTMCLTGGTKCWRQIKMKVCRRGQIREFHYIYSLVPRVLSYPPYVGWVGENLGTKLSNLWQRTRSGRYGEVGVSYDKFFLLCYVLALIIYPIMLIQLYKKYKER